MYLTSIFRTVHNWRFIINFNVAVGLVCSLPEEQILLIQIYNFSTIVGKKAVKKRADIIFVSLKM